jgi:hypothetical protein
MRRLRFVRVRETFADRAASDTRSLVIRICAIVVKQNSWALELHLRSGCATGKSSGVRRSSSMVRRFSLLPGSGQAGQLGA